MRNTTGKTFDLAAAVATVAEQPSAQLTVAELVRAFSVARCDGSDTSLRKWSAAFGSTSAWGITSEQL